MLSAAQRKSLIALHRKSERQAQRLFLVEGVKLVDELLASGWDVECIYAVEGWASCQPSTVPVVRLSEADLSRVSAMETPNKVLAVARMSSELSPPSPSGLVLALAGIRDPGNVGTILRLADWFGVSHIVASPDCAERFNPKVVQASMGSVFRMPVHVIELAQYFEQIADGVDVAAACLHGENLFSLAPREPAVVILGNEGQGIPDSLARYVRRRITIPGVGRAESLNVAAAAAVICAEWRRSSLARM